MSMTQSQLRLVGMASFCTFNSCSMAFMAAAAMGGRRRHVRLVLSKSFTYVPPLSAALETSLSLSLLYGMYHIVRYYSFQFD